MTKKPVPEFDEGLAECLTPLVRDGVFLHVPLFANTCPIEYHFALSLEMEGREDQANSRIIRSNWAEQPSPFPSPGLSVFYATRAWINRQDLGPRRLVHVPVTTYLPTLLFVETSKRTRDVLEASAEISPELNETLAADLFGRPSAIEIVSDTPEQGAFIADFLRRLLRLPSSPVVFGPLSLHQPRLVRSATEQIERVFYLGGPGTERLKEFSTNYLGLTIPQAIRDITGFDETFETHLCITTEEERDDLEGLLDPVKRYHAELYRSAHRSPEDLRSVTRYYNLLAIGESAGYLYSSEVHFATCLREHHCVPKTAQSEDSERRDFVDPHHVTQLGENILDSELREGPQHSRGHDVRSRDEELHASTSSGLSAPPPQRRESMALRKKAPTLLDCRKGGAEDSLTTDPEVRRTFADQARGFGVPEEMIEAYLALRPTQEVDEAMTPTKDHLLEDRDVRREFIEQATRAGVPKHLVDAYLAAGVRRSKSLR